MTEHESPESNSSEVVSEPAAFERRNIMAKLVAAAALAAAGLVSGEANADPKVVSKVVGPDALKLDKTDKWLESSKVFKESAIKFHKHSTGFRVEIQANPELGAALRSMGLVPNVEGGSVKLAIEFTNT